MHIYRLPAMRVIFLGLLLAGLLPAMASARAAVARITTQSELTDYLPDAPPGTSPLDELSAGARKRFLGLLVFGRRGLASLPLGEPGNELTVAQAKKLFALFGVEDAARGVGLTPSSYASIQHERAVDAAKRGCTVGTCPESAIELRYDELTMPHEDAGLSDAGRAARNRDSYDSLFKNYRTRTAVHPLSDPDVRLLKRAGEFAAFFAPDAARLAQLKTTLAEMEQRHMLDDEGYGSLYQGLITSRQFAPAEALRKRHAGMHVTAAPELRQGRIFTKQWPTALLVDAQGRTMSRVAVDLSSPLRIVIVASCHFSQDAARAIQADPELRPLFAEHAAWLAGAGEHFSSAADWNQHFPDQPIHIAWKTSEWSMLDSWEMPTFYVFRDGALVKKFSGWFDLETLKGSLRTAGALR